MKTVCTFKLAKETPGALQYKQVSQDGTPLAANAPADAALVGTLYLRKAHFDALQGTSRQYPDEVTAIVLAFGEQQ